MFKLNATTSEPVLHKYHKTLEYLEAHDGDLPEDIPYIKNLARGVHASYMDIMQSIAIAHLPDRLRPKEIILYVGEWGSGKSLLIEVIRKLTESQYIITKHSINQLISIHSRGMFDELVGHINLSDTNDYNHIRNPECIPAMVQENNSSTMYVTMYKLPKGKNIDDFSSAADKFIPIELNARFYTENKGLKYTKEEEDEILSEEHLANLFAVTCALATYIGKNGGPKFSKRVKRCQAIIRTSGESVEDFILTLTKYFRGFETYKFLYSEYCRFCLDLGYVPVDTTVMKKKIREMGIIRKTEYMRGGPVKVYRFTTAAPNRYIAMDTFVEELGATIEEATCDIDHGEKVQKISILRLLDRKLSPKPSPTPIE